MMHQNIFIKGYVDIRISLSETILLTVSDLKLSSYQLGAYNTAMHF